MAFSSVIFVCVFLPAVCILNGLIPGVRGRNILLAAASLLFYAFGDPAHLLLLLGSVLVALLAEGVGRNNDGLYQYPTPDRRPPRGGRG